MVKTIGIAALTAAFVGVASMAMAQGSHEPTGFSIRAGVFFPTDENVRKNSTGWFAMGVDYKLPMKALEAKTDVLSLSLDYTSRGNFRTVPVLLNVTRHNGPMYVSGGLGVAFSRRAQGAGVEDKTQFAYSAAFGYEFATSDFPLFVEARWMGNGRPELNGAVVYVGARF